MSFSVNHKPWFLFVALLFLMQCSSKKESHPMPQTLLFLGDSITEGFRLKPSESFPSRIADRLQSSGYSLRIINGGRSGDTSADALFRLKEMLKTVSTPELCAIELGYNDAFLQWEPSETEENLNEIISLLKKNRPQIRIFLFQTVLFMGFPPAYRREFESVYPRVAGENRITLLDDPMRSLPGRPGLFQADGVHPTADGMFLIAEDIFNSLEPYLQEYRAEK